MKNKGENKIDSETYLKDGYSYAKNAHYNIPVGNDAKIQYTKDIRLVTAINPKKYEHIKNQEEYEDVVEKLTFLSSLGKYYEEIANIYETKLYTDNYKLIFDKNIDVDTLKIGNEEKRLLSEVIEAIGYKKEELHRCMKNYLKT